MIPKPEALRILEEHVHAAGERHCDAMYAVVSLAEAVAHYRAALTQYGEPAANAARDEMFDALDDLEEDSLYPFKMAPG